MSALRKAIEDYIDLRRQLGFKLDRPQRWLREFASFMEDCGAPFITNERALQWALRPQRAHPSYWARRLIAVRCCPSPLCDGPSNASSSVGSSPQSPASSPSVSVFRARHRAAADCRQGIASGGRLARIHVRRPVGAAGRHGPEDK